MPRYLIVIMVAALLALSAAAQEEAVPGEPATDVEESDTDGDAEEVDDSDLDEQSYEEDEDDFIPTEEIPADEPIPFPTNI